MSNKPDIVAVHSSCSNHRDTLPKFSECGCFYCGTTFPPDTITEWVDDAPGDLGHGTTALCPKCGIDSVIPMQAGMDAEFLRKMKAYWF